MDNIPVFGAEPIVHLNADGSFKFVCDITVISAPNYQDYEAVDLAVDSNGSPVASATVSGSCPRKRICALQVSMQARGKLLFISMLREKPLNRKIEIPAMALKKILTSSVCIN